MSQAAPEGKAYDEEKFKELVLYVAARLSADMYNGSVKLNKVLFYSDVLHYAAYGTPITGAEYLKHPLGPAPRGMKRIQAELIDAGRADLAIVAGGSWPQKMLFAKTPPNVGLFSGTEIEMVERVLKSFADRSGKEVSDLSHELLGWQVARDREVIPYYSVFLYDGPVTDVDVQHAYSIAEKLRPELERAGAAISA